MLKVAIYKRIYILVFALSLTSASAHSESLRTLFWGNLIQKKWGSAQELLTKHSGLAFSQTRIKGSAISTIRYYLSNAPNKIALDFIQKFPLTVSQQDLLSGEDHPIFYSLEFQLPNVSLEILKIDPSAAKKNSFNFSYPLQLALQSSHTNFVLAKKLFELTPVSVLRSEYVRTKISYYTIYYGHSSNIESLILLAPELIENSDYSDLYKPIIPLVHAFNKCRLNPTDKEIANVRSVSERGLWELNSFINNETLMTQMPYLSNSWSAFVAMLDFYTKKSPECIKFDMITLISTYETYFFTSRKSKVLSEFSTDKYAESLFNNYTNYMKFALSNTYNISNTLAEEANVYHVVLSYWSNIAHKKPQDSSLKVVETLIEKLKLDKNTSKLIKEAQIKLNNNRNIFYKDTTQLISDLFKN